MPDLDWNRALWDTQHDWAAGEGGEEWSAPWGGSEPQWFGSLYPRLHRWLPAQNILEIGPGFGRWTKFLILACDRFVGVDLSAKCIRSCRETFARASHATFVVNDGMTLPEGGPFDFVFSFDSLVHAELDIFESYVPQILSKLSRRGVAFIHHSNLASSNHQAPNPHLRARSVSAERLRHLISRAGGALLVQEIINWRETAGLDCLSLFGRRNGFARTQPTVLENAAFMAEATLVREVQARWNNVGRREATVSDELP
jgi:cyclopropane fatty-acyl-phospholipid synthase-like methyltransferase